MGSRSWRVDLADGSHYVVLEHGEISGRIVLRVDGQERIRTRSLWKAGLSGWDHAFGLSGHAALASIRSMGRGEYAYDLFVDGRSTSTGKPYAPRRPVARVVTDGAIGILVPVGVLGGISALARAARDPGMELIQLVTALVLVFGSAVAITVVGLRLSASIHAPTNPPLRSAVNATVLVIASYALFAAAVFIAANVLRADG